MRVLKKSGAVTPGRQHFAEKNMKMVISAAIGIAIFLILFFVILAPAGRELADRKKKWKELEVRLVEGRGKLDAFKFDKPDIKKELEELRRRLPSKSPTSAILEELTKKGKGLNIDFISITPQPAEQDQRLRQDPASESKCKILPININMRSSYKSFGEYLGLLENLDSSFATVGEFQVARDDRTFPKLTVNMRIYTYILEGAESGQK